MNSVSLLVARLALGVSMFGHGVVRFPKIEAFANGMTKSFEASILPASLVLPFGYILPVIEFVVGVLLIAGLFSRFALVLGSLAMIALIFGSALIEQWGYIQIQLVHIAFFVLLLNFIKQDHYSLDFLIKKRV